MLFRPTRMNELDQVMSIIEDGRAALAAQGLDQWQAGSPSRADLARDIEQGTSRVVEDESTGALLGTVAYITDGEPDYARLVEGSWLLSVPVIPQPGKPVQFATLHRFAVAAKARKQGVASFMIKEATQAARKEGMLSLRGDTHEGNVPMQHTFSSNGFTRCCKVDLSDEREPTKLRIGYELIL